MPRIPVRGSELVRFDVDMELVMARMRNMQADMAQLTDVYREAVQPIWEAYLAALPWGDEERRGPRMAKDAYKRVTLTRGGEVGLRHTGRTADPSHHSGVTEFGGTIPVPHSKTNPKLRGKRRMLSRKKPWIGGKAGGWSYYLYPMWEKEWELTLPPFYAKLREVCRRYMPSGRV